MKNKFLVFISIAAIIAAVIFFIYSIIQLLGLGLSVGRIPKTLPNNIIQIINFIALNFKKIISTLLIINLILTSIIYIGFIYLSKKTNSRSIKIASYVMLISNFLVFLLTLLIYNQSEIISIFNLKLNILDGTFGIINILFGILLITWKNKKSYLTKSIGILYILQGIVLITTFLTPLRLAEFTIAIRVLEAVFFSSYIKEL